MTRARKNINIWTIERTIFTTRMLYNYLANISQIDMKFTWTNIKKIVITTTQW